MKRTITLLFLALFTSLVSFGHTVYLDGNSATLTYTYKYVQNDVGDWGVKLEANTTNPDTHLIEFKILWFGPTATNPEIRGLWDRHRSGEPTIVYFWFPKGSNPHTFPFVLYSVVGFQAIESKVERVK